MGEFVDDTLGRYLDQQPGMREALLSDPVQKMQAEMLRRTLAMTESALIDEGVSEDVRRRVINRVVWGEAEGRIDMHARMDEVRKQIFAQVLREMPSAGPVRPDEEPT